MEESRGEENGQSFEVVIPGAFHALRFGEGSTDCWVLHMRLNAESDAERIRQLEEATAWVRKRVSKTDTVIFGGDRNLVLSEAERMSSAMATKRTSPAMREAWATFLASFRGRQVGQPEFTWRREGKEKRTGRAMWQFAILDVAGTNVGEEGERGAIC